MPSYAILSLADLSRDQNSSRYTLNRVTPMLATVLDLERTSSALTQYLIRTWRIQKALNRDGTQATAIRLHAGPKNAEDDTVMLVLNCVVAPQGAAGSAKWSCNVLLCLGKPGAEGRIEFAYCMHRSGRLQLVEAVLSHLAATYDCIFSAVQISPHSLAFLASAWTRAQDDDDDDDNDDGEDEENENDHKRTRRSQHVPLRIEFAMEKAVRDKGLGTIKLTIEQHNVRALHALIENQGGEAPNEAADDPTPAFTRALCAYVSAQLHIHVTGASIASISTPAAEVTQDGNIKFKAVPRQRELAQLAEAAAPATAVIKRKL